MIFSCRKNHQGYALFIPLSTTFDYISTQVSSDLIRYQFVTRVFQNLAISISITRIATNGHLALVREVLKNIPSSILDRGPAIKGAAEKGHLAIIQELLKDNPCLRFGLKDYRLESIVIASENGYLEIINELLTNDENYRGIAVIFAADKGHLRVVQGLLKDNAIIPDESRVQGIVCAAENGHLNIVNELLKNSEECRGKALIYALRHEHYGAIAVIQNTGKIGEYDHIEAVLIAELNNDHRAVRESLLKNTECGRGMAVKFAARNGRSDRIAEVFKIGTVGENDRVTAIELAARRNHPGAVSTLLNFGPISLEDHGRVVKYAAENGHLEVIRVLMSNNTTILKDDLNLAIALAAVNYHDDVVQELRIHTNSMLSTVFARSMLIYRESIQRVFSTMFG